MALCKDKCNSYWRSKIDTCSGNMKTLWWTLDVVLGNDVTEESGELLAEEFAAFFQDKVDAVYPVTSTTLSYDVSYRSTPTMDDCSSVTRPHKTEAHQLGTVQVLSAGSGSNVAAAAAADGDGRAVDWNRFLGANGDILHSVGHEGLQSANGGAMDAEIAGNTVE